MEMRPPSGATRRIGSSGELLDMKVNNASLSSPRPAEAAQPVARTGQSGGFSPSSAASSDDIHLSELVQSLRSLVGDSPERQARMEQIARSYASGSYRVDPQATASGIIDDAIRSS